VDFFDPRTQPTPLFHQELPPFALSETTNDSEILSCAFSPDGIFFSCARDDNVAHVWDSRFIAQSRGPLRKLKHRPGDGKYRYGITGLTWLDHHGSSSPPVLVTGGDDGRILSWDMRKAEPEVLAELDVNVGCFSLGNIHNGEMPLIAGDCDGLVYIYDRRRSPP